MTAKPRQVLVIGSGGAGVTAALEASRCGANVLLFEARDQLGGATSWSGGILYAGGTHTQKKAGVQDTKEELLAYYQAVCQWTVSPQLLQTVVDGGEETVSWLEELGVVFRPEDLYIAGMELKPRGHKPTGDTGGRGPAGGAVIINAVVNAFDESKIQVHTNTRITTIERRTDHISVTSEDGREFHGDSVIFASGGFGASISKMSRYFPDAVKTKGRTRYIGPDSNQGDGIDMGLSVGGIVTNENNGGLNITPNFLDVVDPYMPPWLLLVNLHGKRFTNEMAPYSILGPTVVAQPESRCYGIFDSRALTYVRNNPPDPDPYGLGFKMRSNWEAEVLDKEITNGRIIKADSLAELASLIAIPVESLEYTIQKWNLDAAKGQDYEFGKRSSAMFSLDQPPFYAADVRPSSVGITYAGLKIDEQARLLDQFARPIPNFYAAGEVAGGLEKTVYPGGGYSIVTALLFGIIAGRNASKEAKQSSILHLKSKV